MKHNNVDGKFIFGQLLAQKYSIVLQYVYENNGSIWLYLAMRTHSKEDETMPLISDILFSIVVIGLISYGVFHARKIKQVRLNRTDKLNNKIIEELWKTGNEDVNQ